MPHRLLVTKPKSERARKTLNRILSAAAQAFNEKGYHGTSISDITKLADVSTGTLYVYFESKYDLYKFLLFQCSHIIRKHLNEATKDCTTRREQESAGLRAWLEFVPENRYVYNIIWEALYVDRELFMEYYKEFSYTYIQGINAAKERGEISSEIDSEVLAWMLMGTSSFLGLNWGLFKDRPGNVGYVVNSFMRIIGNGVFNEEARPDAECKSLPICIQVDFDDDEV